MGFRRPSPLCRRSDPLSLSIGRQTVSLVTIAASAKNVVGFEIADPSGGVWSRNRNNHNPRSLISLPPRAIGKLVSGWEI